MNDSQLLSYVEAGDANGDKSIIWMHGLGADGHDFEPIVAELQLPTNSGTRFLFPHAPQRPITLNGGMVMRAWYDVYALDATAAEDEAGIKQSEQQIQRLIQHELDRGVSPAKIILAGFSQGGAMALFTGLRYPQPLAGILALSCYLPLASQFSPQAQNGLAPRSLPIMQVHGIYDPVVPFSMGEDSKSHLKQLGYAVEWHRYPMDHSVCAEEIRDIGAWLKQVLLE